MRGGFRDGGAGRFNDAARIFLLNGQFHSADTSLSVPARQTERLAPDSDELSNRKFSVFSAVEAKADRG